MVPRILFINWSLGVQVRWILGSPKRLQLFDLIIQGRSVLFPEIDFWLVFFVEDLMYISFLGCLFNALSFALKFWPSDCGAFDWVSRLWFCLLVCNLVLTRIQSCMLRKKFCRVFQQGLRFSSHHEAMGLNFGFILNSFHIIRVLRVTHALNNRELVFVLHDGTIGGWTRFILDQGCSSVTLKMFDIVRLFVSDGKNPAFSGCKTQFILVVDLLDKLSGHDLPRHLLLGAA